MTTKKNKISKKEAKRRLEELEQIEFASMPREWVDIEQMKKTMSDGEIKYELEKMDEFYKALEEEKTVLLEIINGQ